MKKLKKLAKNPGIFLRDYFNKKYPILLNEMKCPKQNELIIIDHNLFFESNESVNFPIDVVFTWVNDSDLSWKEKFFSYKKETNKNHGRFALDKARFNNHDELRYSVESVLRYIPWVRNIFIITDNQKPSWIEGNDLLTEKIKIVDHANLIGSCYLPTFNSHVIEAHLHLIEGLSEHFIYFNDDVFVARPIPPGHFFKSNGLSSLFVSTKSIKNMLNKGVKTPTLAASINSASLLQRDFVITVDQPLVHTYVPLRKSYYNLAWEKYGDEIKSFLASKFRTDADLNLATFLVPWLTYLEGGACVQTDICYYFNIRSTAARLHYKELISGHKSGILPHSFCANDFNTENKQMIDYDNKLKSFLQSFYN